MGKRAKGEGTIFFSAARGKWVAQLPAGADGKRHLKTAATEAEALILLRQMHAERAAGRDLSRRAETVEELMTNWLEMMKPHVRATTLGYYQARVQNITTRIGKLRAQDVTTELVQRLANDMALAGLGPAYVRATLTRLRAAYERLIEGLPLGAETHELFLRQAQEPPWEELTALAALAHWVALNRCLWYNRARRGLSLSCRRHKADSSVDTVSSTFPTEPCRFHRGNLRWVKGLRSYASAYVTAAGFAQQGARKCAILPGCQSKYGIGSARVKPTSFSRG